MSRNIPFVEADLVNGHVIKNTKKVYTFDQYFLLREVIDYFEKEFDEEVEVMIMDPTRYLDYDMGWGELPIITFTNPTVKTSLIRSPIFDNKLILNIGFLTSSS